MDVVLDVVIRLTELRRKLSARTKVATAVFFFEGIEAATIRSIVLRYACAPTATRSYLTTVCVLFSFLLFLVSFWTCRYFPGFCVVIAVSFLYDMESTSCVFSFRMYGVFLPCNDGLYFWH